MITLRIAMSNVSASTEAETVFVDATVNVTDRHQHRVLKSLGAQCLNLEIRLKRVVW